jgi:hypothetical protein
VNSNNSRAAWGDSSTPKSSQSQFKEEKSKPPRKKLTAAEETTVRRSNNWQALESAQLVPSKWAGVRAAAKTVAVPSRKQSVVISMEKAYRSIGENPDSWKRSCEPADAWVAPVLTEKMLLQPVFQQTGKSFCPMSLSKRGSDETMLRRLFIVGKGEAWRKKDKKNWLSAVAMSAWTGVTTNFAGGNKVTALDLSGKMQNIKNTEFTDCLNELPHLKQVSYSYGDQYGRIFVDVAKYPSAAAAAIAVEKLAFEQVMRWRQMAEKRNREAKEAAIAEQRELELFKQLQADADQAAQRRSSLFQ